MPDEPGTGGIPPELAKLLQALQALLDIGDTGLIKATASAIAKHGAGTSEVDKILALIGGMKYAEAKGAVDALLSKGARVVKWEDPEIRLLEAELEEVTSALADAEAERAEIERQLRDFNHRFHEELGELMEEILRHRRDALKEASRANPEVEGEAEEAEEDYEKFRSDAEEDKGRRVRELDEEGRGELKALLKKFAKMCHPDVAPEEHREEAEEMFKQLKAAYDVGDLDAVRRIGKQLEAGIFEVEREGDTADARKARLRARIDAVRSHLEKVGAEIEEMKTSPAWKLIVEEDLGKYFGRRRRGLEREVKAMGDKNPPESGEIA